MKARLYMLTFALAAVFAAGVAFASGTSAYADGSCTGNCFQTSTSFSTNQHIDVTVPAALRMVIDNPTQIDWTLAISAAHAQSNTYPDNCYVLPNWVDNSNAQMFMNNAGVTLTQDSKGAVSIDGGNLITPSNATGYPPVFYKNQTPSDGTMTWNQVLAAQNLPASGTPYTSSGRGGEAAKGHLVCFNKFMIEKYSNCGNVSFSATATAGALTGSTDPTWTTEPFYGGLYMQDFVGQLGSSSGLTAAGSGLSSTFFDPTSGLSNGAITLASGNQMPQFTWLNDWVAQALYLRYVHPGTHHIKVVYTLAVTAG